jgi:hypothetical protein
MDEADISDERIMLRTNHAINIAMNEAAKIDPGAAGECDMCGEDRPRLVSGVCCFCRDKWKNYQPAYSE